MRSLLAKIDKTYKMQVAIRKLAKKTFEYYEMAHNAEEWREKLLKLCKEQQEENTSLRLKLWHQKQKPQSDSQWHSPSWWWSSES